MNCHPLNLLPVGVVVAFVDLQRRASPYPEMRAACDELSRALIAKDDLAASSAAAKILELAERFPVSEREREMFFQVGHYWILFA